jgi:hypothetical protein
MLDARDAAKAAADSAAAAAAADSGATFSPPPDATPPGGAPLDSSAVRVSPHEKSPLPILRDRGDGGNPGRR